MTKTSLGIQGTKSLFMEGVRKRFTRNLNLNGNMKKIQIKYMIDKGGIMNKATGLEFIRYSSNRQKMVEP